MKKILLVIVILTGFLKNTALASVVMITSPITGGYTLDQYIAPNNNSPYLHIIGTYEAASTGQQHILSDSNIFIEDHGNEKIYLSLSSYEPTNWIFSGSGANNIAGILLNGYHQSFVTGIDNALITDKTGLGNYIVSCALFSGCSTKLTTLTDFSEILFQTSVSSITTTYRANSYTISHIITSVAEPNLIGLIFIAIGFLYTRRLKYTSK